MRLSIIPLLLAFNAFATTCSWYGPGFEGKRTANGDIFDPLALTAASNHHKMGTRLLVTAGGHSVTVRVNDRLARRFSDRIDLSPAAFKALAPLDQGLVTANVTVIP